MYLENHLIEDRDQLIYCEFAGNNFLTYYFSLISPDANNYTECPMTKVMQLLVVSSCIFFKYFFLE